MKQFLVRIPRSIAILFVLFLSFSCNKDSDLLDSAINVDSKDNSLLIKIYVVDDMFNAVAGEEIVLDVLSNDNIPDLDKVKIIETTAPLNGEVVIIENKTILYLPASTPEETTPATTDNSSTSETTESTDSFTYTVEVQNEDETVTVEEATVTVEVVEAPEPAPVVVAAQNAPVPADVTYWKEKFDGGWSTYSAEIDEFSKSANKNQEYYYFAYYIDGIISMWQATGDNTYLDTAIRLIDETINDAVPMGNYLGWPSSDGQAVPLWDSFYWRFVATLTRIMHQSPNLRSNGTYQAAYERFLAFSEKNMWERYEG
ncbi:MAG: hypothetical protein WBM83_04310, partial [Flavobacteriaceae bacterium]